MKEGIESSRSADGIACACSQAIECIVDLAFLDLTREQHAVDSEDMSRFGDWKAQWS
jgi:hypothetical protein